MNPPPDDHASYHAAARSVERLGIAVVVLAVAIILAAARLAF